MKKSRLLGAMCAAIVVVVAQPANAIFIDITTSQNILLGNGNGLDLSVGAYDLVERPEEGPEWQFNFGISYFFN